MALRPAHDTFTRDTTLSTHAAFCQPKLGYHRTNSSYRSLICHYVNPGVPRVKDRRGITDFSHLFFNYDPPAGRRLWGKSRVTSNKPKISSWLLARGGAALNYLVTKTLFNLCPSTLTVKHLADLKTELIRRTALSDIAKRQSYWDFVVKPRTCAMSERQLVNMVKATLGFSDIIHNQFGVQWITSEIIGDVLKDVPKKETAFTKPTTNLLSRTLMLIWMLAAWFKIATMGAFIVSVPHFFRITCLNVWHDAVNCRRRQYALLGDAVLDYHVTIILLQRYPHLTQGKLTKLKEQYVCNSTLTRVDRRLRSQEWVSDVVRHNDKTYAGTLVEALVGACEQCNPPHIVHELVMSLMHVVDEMDAESSTHDESTA